MATTLDRLVNERLFHDAQAASRAASFRRGEASLRFDDAAYLDHESWIRPAFAKLGDVRGSRVLDLGCGHGMASVVLARRGACVTATDLSAGYVNETRQRAIANGVRIEALVADAHELPLPEESFDAIWGSAILHHLDQTAMARELHRLLVPGGVAVFCEPWSGNPLLRLARAWLPYAGKHRTRDERPLEPGDIPVLRRQFPDLTVQGFQFFGMLKKLHPRLRVFEAIDRRLPFLENFGRYVVIAMRKN